MISDIIRPQGTRKPPGTIPQEKPLQSWKEIAAYLERDERTARRWEKEEGLPVRRHCEDRRSSVYAYPSELDAWRLAREPKSSRRPVLRWSVPAVLGFLVVILGAWFIKYSPIFNPPNPLVEAADGIVVRDVWAGPEVGDSGGPSPDGNYLSFVDWETGDLAIRELTTGTTRRLTEKGHAKPPWANAMNSTISRDGKQVAYSWCSGEKELCDLYVIGMDGTGDRLLVSSEDENVFPVSWSSNGELISAFRYTPESGITEALLVRVADGSIRVLKSGGVSANTLSFSADDRYLAYEFPVEDQQKKHDISLLATDGSGELPLIIHPANDRLLGWVPKNDQLLFLSDREGSWDIWVADVVQGRLQGSPQPLKRDVGDIRPQGFAADGTLFFCSFTRFFTLQTAPFDQTTGMMKPELAKPLFGSNFSPVWSPDGKYLAYLGEKKVPTGHVSYFARTLQIRNDETGEVRELASDFNARVPRWSRDSQHIVFRGFERSDRSSGYYRVSVSPGEVTPVVQDISDAWWTHAAEWSMDGKAIYYVDKGRLVLRDVTSNEEQELYKNPDLTGILKLSPNGRWLVLGTDPSERAPGHLLIMPSSGGEVRELFKKPEDAFRITTATWTPDSSYILFVIAVKNPGDAELWRVFPEGGDAEKLWQSKQTIWGLGVHPSRSEIAFSLYTQESTISAMEAYLVAEK